MIKICYQIEYVLESSYTKYGKCEITIIIINSNNENYAKKTMKMMKNTITTPNILTMSQRLEVMPLKYLSSSTCAASTFVMASSTLSSILYVREGRGRDEGIGGDRRGW